MKKQEIGLFKATGRRSSRPGFARKILSAAGLVLCAVIAIAPGGSATAGQTAPALSDAIKAEINSVLGSKYLSGAGVGIEVRELPGGKVIYSNNAGKLLVPASNMKIVTAAAALAVLKPEYTFKTEVYADNLKDGVISGNIYLKGYGDPLLVDENLWTIARDLAYRGVSKVTGSVLADDSYFDDERHGKGWGELGPEAYNAPIGALSLNFNTFVISAIPAPAAGLPPRVFIMPPNRHVNITNRAETVASGRPRLKVLETADKVNSYEVVGYMPLGSEVEQVRRTIGDPGLYAAGSFEAYLMSWGIAVSGMIGRETVPGKAQLLLVYNSPPLSRAIWSMGKISNNFVAEQVLKTMGAEATPEGQPKIGTAEGGIKVVQQYMAGLGIKPDEYVMADGSGLSRLDRLTVHQINTVLASVYNDPTYFPEFLSSLGVGGVDGTVEDRFKKDGLKRRCRAKTGHLTGVNALSGYLQTDSGKMLSFSIIFNNFSGYHSTVEKLQENILLALSKY